MRHRTVVSCLAVCFKS